MVCMDEHTMREQFQVGGQDRELSEPEQLEQLASYFHATYEAPAKNPPWSAEPSDPLPADTFDARMPDRLTHAAMLMLGSGLDHSMPGVAFIEGVTTSNADGINAQVFHPRNPNGTYAISLHPGGWWKGGGVAMENAWRPEVAAVANLSGTTMVDLDYPLLPGATVAEVMRAVEQAAQWARAQGASKVFAWGYSSGGALAVLCSELFDAQALTFPHLDLSMLPAELREGVDFPGADTFPPTLMQLASNDAIAGTYEWAQAGANVKVREYCSEHRVSTPAVARQRVEDVAEFFRAQASA
ncbi:alpha/beta hydrolase [Corynebacterium sp. 76QC2CO]|nr:alpha/beta hydrolase [Corynebacterium sp. 76QC2CO]MCQ9343524.1 alpha/beta hydrolase [Corynebacterium sp. 76QC2CO]